MARQRLQKILARAGVASRRACEELIAEGRVCVDGDVVTEPGTKADPDTQDVRLDGRRLRPESREYWILNKPKGVVCTNDDPAGRTRPIDLIPGTKARLFPVGRLDADSQGLLLMTNDGELANRLTHPRYEVPKTYRATVSGRVTGKEVERLVGGVHLAEGKTLPARVKVLKRGRSRSTLQITLREGRNRHIRRVLARLSHPVRELVRTRIGRLSVRGLGSGKARRLTRDEVEYLKTLPDRRSAKRPGRGRKKAGTRKHPSRRRQNAKADAASSGKGDAPKRNRRSTRKHDSVGTGKTGRDNRHDSGGGKGRKRRSRDRSAARGRGTRRDSRQ